MEHKDNPFNVVKAGDFSDKQINEFWVDFPGDNGFDTLAKPKSTMPMIIKGGKGSGKTHLMRHYSYQLQKLRHSEDVIKGLISDGYMGVYLKLGGLNTKRFNGKGVSQEAWMQYFAYYVDVWLSQLLLDNIIELVELVEMYDEKDICNKILQLFDTDIELENKTFDGIRSFLRETQRNIDLSVNNCLWEPINIKILCSPGRLLFGIPQILSKEIKEFENTIFVYLIDELESLFDFQQKYIQTLIREKELPCSIKVGARSHGIKTYETLADGEFNKDGSEFELIVLEEKIKENNNYNNFAIQLCIKRLFAAGYLDQFNDEHSLDEYFESAPVYKNIDKIDGVDTGIKGKVLKRLSEQLTKNNIDLETKGVIQSFICKDMPLIERAAAYCLYNDWSKGLDLKASAELISSDIKSYIAQNIENPNRIHSALDHYKLDFVTQLTPNQNKRNAYCGLHNIIKVSDGFPRSLLTIFKHIFVAAKFNRESPFESGKISRKSQIEGILDATEWFINDARMTGKDGNKLKIAVGRLSEIFRLNRFADKPRECSLTTFSVNEEKISEESQRLIELCTQWSLLIGDSKGRKDRNSKRIDKKYKLNFMLSPFWELPIASRGVYSMPPELINSIFDENFDVNYDSEKSKFMKTLSPPFKNAQGKLNQGSLF